VAQPSPVFRRSAGERLVAWLYTGPLGHLWSVVADISLAWARWARSAARARVRARLGR
jgi:hypothetical protein